MFERRFSSYRHASLFLKFTLFGALVLSLFQPTAHADAKTVLAKLPAAENLIVTSDNRLLVGAQDGLYLVPRDGQPASKIPVAFSLSSTPSTANQCFFFGMTQIGQYVYASCTPDPGSSTSPRYLLLINLQQPLAARAFYTVTDANIFNGVTSDSTGALYLSSFPVNAASGRIVRVVLSSPTVVASRTNWLYLSGKPNGLKTYGSTLYFVEGQINFNSGYSRFKKVAINSNGTPGVPQTIYTIADVNTVMDDFMLVNGGIVLCAADVYGSGASTRNRVVHISESGQLLHTSTAALQLPSAVALDKSSTTGAFFVTERGSTLLAGSGDVARYVQSWGLAPR